MDFTEEQLLEMLVEKMGNPMDFGYEESDMLRIFTEMSKIEGAKELFRNMMGKDMKLHFMAKGDNERDHIKGAYARTAWIRGIMNNVDKYKELKQIKAKREA